MWGRVLFSPGERTAPQNHHPGQGDNRDKQPQQRCRQIDDIEHFQQQTDHQQSVNRPFQPLLPYHAAQQASRGQDKDEQSAAAAERRSIKRSR